MVDVPNLDPTSRVPIYRQLYQRLVEDIERGKLSPGAKIPGTREMAGLLGVSRTTILDAYAQLEADGWIASKQRGGSFVTSRGALRQGGINWDTAVEVSELRRPVSARVQISFAHSRPDEDLFPLEEFSAACSRVLQSDELSRVLQLGSPGGYEPLRQTLSQLMQEEGVAGPTDGILITSGCQQALDLLRRVLVRPGDRVLLEDPVYPGIKNVFLESNPELVGIPMNANGLDLQALERAMHRGARLLVVTPNFQNPTGLTMSLAARKELLRLAHQMRTIVVENDSYGRLRYRGDDVPSLKELDTSGDVILLRSFSKMAFPGLRIGWVSAPQRVITAMTEAKYRSDLHSDQFSQAVMLDFVLDGGLVRHQETIREEGLKRLQAALASCREHLPAGSIFTEPDGGMNLWITLPDALDAGELLQRAEREGITYLPGRSFSVMAEHRNSLRLSFAGVKPRHIEQGIAALSRVFKSDLADRLRALREPAPALV
jgi:2-aminoadipate transaminase